MRMRKAFLILICLLSVFCAAGAEETDRPKAAPALFYKANSHYEQGDFQKAQDVYGEILRQGIRSANLYYNMGNTYFKLGSLGRAVLYYEKAIALAPQDADLKANLEYAESLVEGQAAPSQKMWLVRFLDNLTSQLSLDSLATAISILYYILACLVALGIIYRKGPRKMLLWPVAGLALISVIAVSSFAVRIYEMEFLRPAIIIQEETECRFEPFDGATVYFKIREGNKVFVLLTKKGWSKIRRLDGKTGWLKNDAIETI